MYLEQEYKFHFLSFWGQGGSKLAMVKRKKSGYLEPPPRSVRHPVQVQIQIVRGIHLKKTGI